MFYHASHSLSEAIKQKVCLSEPWKDSHQHNKTKNPVSSQSIRYLPSQVCLHLSKQPDQGMHCSPHSPTCQLSKLQSSLHTPERYRFRIKTTCFLKSTIRTFKYRPKILLLLVLSHSLLEEKGNLWSTCTMQSVMSKYLLQVKCYFKIKSFTQCFVSSTGMKLSEWLHWSRWTLSSSHLQRPWCRNIRCMASLSEILLQKYELFALPAKFVSATDSVCICRYCS